MVGMGIDIVAVARIADMLDRHGPRFIRRCFHDVEIPSESLEMEQTTGPDPAILASHWAAKEAFLKALGADVRPIPYRDIEVVTSLPGRGRLVLHGRALEALTLAGGNRIHLTLTQEGTLAMASVLIEE